MGEVDEVEVINLGIEIERQRMTVAHAGEMINVEIEVRVLVVTDLTNRVQNLDRAVPFLLS